LILFVNLSQSEKIYFIMVKTIFKLKSKFKLAGDQSMAKDKLVRGIKRGNRLQTLLGVTGSGKTFTMANVIASFDMPVLVIAPNKALAAQLYREYKNFFPENSVNYFVSYYDYYQPESYIPITDTYIEKEAMINEEIDKLRHRTTSALLTRRDVIVVSSVSCIYNLGVPLNYMGSSIHLEIGKPITRGDLIKQLIRIQFKRTIGQIKRGSFRIRGDVFEIIPASSNCFPDKTSFKESKKNNNVIYRINLFEQKVRSIYVLDVLSRKQKKSLEELIIFPVKHFISFKPQIEEAIKNIKEELRERLRYFKKKKLYLEAERLERRTRYDMEMLKTLGFCHGIENYSRHLTGKLPGEAPDTLLEYFPKKKDGSADFLTIIDESHITVPQIQGMYAGDKSRKQTLIEYGWRLPSALDNRPLKFEEFKKRVGQLLFTSATPGEFERKNSDQIVKQIIRPTGLVDPAVEIRPVYNQETKKSQVDDLMEEAEKVINKKERIIINVLTKRMAEDLSEFLRRKKFRVKYVHSEIKTLNRPKILTDFRKGKFDILVGVNLLREGLDFPEVSLVAVLDADREGFLRSEISLIQTMGRATRNVHGKIILYADNITQSIKKAVREVERRRIIQQKYNKKHNIIAKSIKKDIEDLMGA